MGKSSESKIDRLRKRLNSNQRSRESSGGGRKSRLSSQDTSGIRKRWDHDDGSGADDSNTQNNNDGNSRSLLDTFLVFSALFFIVAFAFAYFSVGDTGVSPDKVDISIAGPEEVSAGDTVSLNIDITNNNKVTLSETDLIIEYPAGTRSLDESDEELHRTRESIGKLESGETIRKNAEVNLFGGEGDQKRIDISLEYQVEDSNAIFTASNNHIIDISESPVSINIEAPEQVTAGESFSINANIQSNSSRPLEGLLLVANYPFGFEVQEIDPGADYRNYVWQLGDVSPGDEESVEITGAFTDTSANQEQTFRFDIGSARTGEPTEIGALYASRDVTTSLEEAFINLGLDLDVQQDNGGSNLDVDGDISWSSNLDTTARGGEITADLSGSAIDRDSIDSDDGLLSPGDNSIIWNARTNDELQDIASGDSGNLRFDFSTEDSMDIMEAGLRNPVIDIGVEMSAGTPDDDSLPDPVTANIEREVRLPTVVQLTADTLYEDGPFTNSGPTPPEVGEETTYTLHLSLANTTNDISEATFQAVLPAYVELAGDPQPDSSFSYNETSGRMSWDMGSIPAGAGYSEAPEEIFIPVRITPNRNQVNQTLPLLDNLIVSGTDVSTNETLQIDSISPPTTQLDDLRSNGESGEVQD